MILVPVVSFRVGVSADAPVVTLGRRLLGEMSPKRFRQAVIPVVVVSGLAMLWDQRGLMFDLM